jgi:hypothetical protein
MFSAMAMIEPEVLGQRRIDMVAVHGRLHHGDDAPISQRPTIQKAEMAAMSTGEP